MLDGRNPAPFVSGIGKDPYHSPKWHHILKQKRIRPSNRGSEIACSNLTIHMIAGTKSLRKRRLARNIVTWQQHLPKCHGSEAPDNMTGQCLAGQ